MVSRYKNREFFAFQIALIAIFLTTLNFFFSKPIAFASETTFTNSSDWEAGTMVNLDTSVKEGDLSIEAAGTIGARSWRTPDLTLGVGSSFASDGTNIYATRGNGDVLFWKYSPANDTWTTLADMPRGTYYGSELEYLNGYIYAMFGGYQTAFARYSIANNSWEMLNSLPDLVYTGAGLTNDGTNLYATRGNGTQDFYKYDVADNSWDPLSGLPATISAGADLVRVGDYIYMPRGSSTTTFYRYSISAKTWSVMAVLPATLTEETEITTDGTKIYVTRQAGTNTSYAYNIAANTWSTLTNLPGLARYAGSIYHSGDGYVYVFQGNSQYNFWKYNPTTNTFVGVEDAPTTLSTGSDFVYYGGNIYILRGSSSTTFYRYNVAANTWTTLAVTPATLADDTKGVAAGNYLYFFRGSSTNTFYRYDIVGNSWSTMANTPATVGAGGTLTYPGSGDYIYATRGNTTLSVWRYSISANTWDDPSVADLPADAEAAVGSRLISNGTDLFYIAGNGISRFYKYTVASNTWTEMTKPPFAPFYGTDLAYYDGKIVALAGWYKNSMFEYDISDNSWRKLQNIPGYLAQDLGFYAGASLEYDGNNSFYISYANGRTNVLTYTPAASKYASSATWTSEPRDLQYVSSFGNFTVTESNPGGSDILYETRTSNDALSWSAWASVSGSTITSPAQKYIQVRATLVASNGANHTPTLSEISIAYTGDNSVPTNPTNATGSSQEVNGVSLNNGASYPYIKPYFTWSGASDAQTSIAGYYVYFGTNELADPQAVGTFQTTTNYSVTEAMSTGTYYLRLKSKDLGGNISEAATLFTYVYAGISPAQSLIVTDFSGTTNKTSNVNDQIKLASRENGFWLQETLSNAPAAMQYGARNTAYVASTGKLYVLRGANVATFYSYDLETDVWTTLANAPGNIYTGGGIVEGPDGYLYALRGNNTSSFYRYDIEANVWSDEAAADTPLTVNYEGAMEFDNGYIYAIRGNDDDAFWRYNTTDDSWEALANLDFGAITNAVNNSAYVGADLAINHADKLIYAVQGNLRDGFAAYSIDTNRWTVLPDLPQLPYYGSSIEYVPSENAVYFIPGNYSEKMYKFDVGSQTWSEVNSAPITFYYGASLKNIGDYLYVVAGNNTVNFYKYSISKDSWLIPNRGLWGRVFQGVNNIPPGYGEDIVKGDGDYFYITRGNYADDFIRYNSKTGEMKKMAVTPVGAYSGASLVYDSTANKIYFTGGYFVQKFYVYDIATNVWSEVTTDPTPAVIDYGSSMVYDGSRYIYLNRGGNNTNFYRYDTQGNAGSRWSTMAVAPGGLGYGAELVLNGNYIYSLQGQNVSNNPFYRYDISANSWSNPAVADLNIDVYNDGFASYGGDGNIYVARAENDNDFYKYSIANNLWTTLANAPANISSGGAGESDGVNKLLMLTGAATGANTFNDGIYTYVMQTSTSGFEESGDYTSSSHDLSSVYKWANLQVDYVSAENANLEIQTRSSDDENTWSSWTAVSSAKSHGTTYNYEINSPVARYIQVKFIFTSADGVYSGVVNNYTINYYKDNSAPTNPQNAGLGAYSDNSPGNVIVSGNWYGHSHPYFSWPAAEATNGASDTSGGSGVAGYYVYFGSDNTADPETAGVLQTGNSYLANNLVDDSIYYLRVRTVDDAGNVSAETWAPFIYRYDSTPSSAPTGLTADPAGYTATDSFDFSWNIATSSGSEVTEYCYKTGATTGDFAADQCTTDTFVAGIPSHKVGANTFYVRSKDEAGNYSAYSSAQYYYADSANAPAPPTNLVVTPSSNTENSFAFSWDPPATGTYYGSVANLSYYYSINALPTSRSTTATSVRSLKAGSYATLPGENVFYIVTKDEAGNVNYSDYASVTFIADTTAPGIPLNMDIADVSVKSTKSWKIALSWEAPAGTPADHYAVYRSTDGETFTKLATSGGISYVDTGLTQQTYYYKVKACDSTNNCGAFSEVVSLLPDGKFVEAASLISDPVISNITTKKATVSWSTARTADSRIAYGTGSGDYFDEEVSNSNQVTTHTLNMLNLSPGTTYYYIVKWTDEDGNTGTSAEATFVTAPAPSTEEPTVKNMGLDSALLEFISKNAAKVRIYYGESSAFGGIEDVVTGSGEGTHTVQLNDLKDGTKYYYKINSFDSEGEEYEGEIHSFETLPRPKIKNIKINQVKGTARSTLLITWESNTSISSIVTYYPITNPGAAKDEINLALKSGKHQMIVYDLDPQTTYGILVKGKDSVGNEAIGELQQIATSADSRAPQISDLKVEGEILGSGQEATAQLLISFNTDEPATAQIEFGEGSGTTYSQKTQEDGSFTNHHMVVISGLTPSKVYHLRALSKDQYNNLGESIDKVVITPKAADSALDLVVSNMSLIFGFLSSN